MARIDTDKQGTKNQRNLVQASREAITREKALDQTRKSGAKVSDAKLLRPDPPDRIATRLKLINSKDPNALERMMGKRDIVSINFFARGLQAAKAICRIKTLGLPGQPPDYATGFLVTSGLMITNNHVLPDPETASRSLAEFDFELDTNFVERRGRIYPFAPIEAFYTSAELDFTIVAISPMAHDGTPISEFGVLPLIPMSGKGLAGEYVSIIQHPAGGTKQVVVRENRIISLDKKKFPEIREEFMHYTADTERGSSGSPVFNDQWDLIGIHHLAIVDRDNRGRPLNKQDKLWTESDGDDGKKWIANEGLRVSALWKHLRSTAPYNNDAARIMSMLSREPNAARRPLVASDDSKPQKWETIPDAPEAQAFETTRFTDRAFASSMGYKANFLDGVNVPLPTTGPRFSGTLAKNSDTGKTVFDYTHFSLAMHVERRLAAWTAVNIDGKEVKSAASPSWRRDKRLPAEQQTLAEVYGKVPGKNLQIDRGHLVRRLDPVWGPQDVADRAGADTFHYTNAAPQEHVYNSETWGNLEDFVLARADNRDHKASVFTGPILRPDDSFYGEGLKGGPWQIPWSFWKICVFRRADGTTSVTGFIIEQRETITPLFEATRYNPYTVEEAKTFQKKISVIEELTNLDFGRLRTMDRLGSVESTSADSVRPIRGAQDIAF